MKTDRFELLNFASDTLLVEAVAHRWWALINRRREPALVALSGGRLAAPLCRALVQAVKDPLPSAERDVPTEKTILNRPPRPSLDGVHFFWADERCVPPDHPDSNYAVAHQHLFAPLNVPEAQIHRIRGEKEPLLAAREAEAELRRWAQASAGRLPVLDLVLLGMGEDGHVASLFPANLARDSMTAEAYEPVIGPKPPPQRITLTYAAIASAREAWVLVAGTGKEEAWRRSLQPDGPTPLARVLQTRPYSRLFTTLPG